MIPLIKKLSYKNIDKCIKKLLKIPWLILKNKQIEYLFDVKNGVFGIFRQEIAIQSQNMVSCIEILISHLCFQYN